MNSDWNKPLPKHLPAPSFAPVILAAGALFLLWGAVTSWVVSTFGLLVISLGAWVWIADLRPRGAAPGEKATPQKAPRRKLMVRRDSDLVAYTPWLHRCAIVFSAATLLLVVTGAMVTSQNAAPTVHLVAGVCAGLLGLGLAFGLGRVGWALMAAVALNALVSSRSPGAGAFHAFLAQLIFAAGAAIALLTSKAWHDDPEFAVDMARPSLGLLANITVGLVVVQVALGAAVRHKLMGSGLHITFALVVALAIVIVGVLVMNQCAQHRTLRPCSIMMMVITGTQVFLGFGAFITRMMAEDRTPPVVIATVAHVTTGALTLASTVILALQLRRHLRPAALLKERSKGAVLP
jgi:heme A synthase